MTDTVGFLIDPIKSYQSITTADKFQTPFMCKRPYLQSLIQTWAGITNYTAVA